MYERKAGSASYLVLELSTPLLEKIKRLVAGLALSIQFPAFIARYPPTGGHGEEEFIKETCWCRFFVAIDLQNPYVRSENYPNSLRPHSMEKLKAETVKSPLEKADEEVDVGVGNTELEPEVADNKNEEYSYESNRSPFPEGE